MIVLGCMRSSGEIIKWSTMDKNSVATFANYPEASAKYNSDIPLSDDGACAGLRAYLIVAESNHPHAAPAPTAIPMGYVAATKSPSDPNVEIHSRQAQVAALQLSPGGAGPNAMHYCWTHGICGQPSIGYD